MDNSIKLTIKPNVMNKIIIAKRGNHAAVADLELDWNAEQIVKACEKLFNELMRNEVKLPSSNGKQTLTSAQRAFYDAVSPMFSNHTPSYGEMAFLADYRARSSAKEMADVLVEKGWFIKDGRNLRLAP